MAMTDYDKIKAVFDDAMSGAGAMLSVRTVCALVQQRVNENPTITVINMYDFLENVAHVATEIADKPAEWTVNGRFDLAAFSRHFFLPVSEYRQRISATIARVLIRMDDAYGDAFRVDGAQNFLRDVAKHAALFSDEMAKVQGGEQ
jgi:hypothetical protein